MSYNKETVSNSFYVIVSGIFRYNYKNLNDVVLAENYTSWENRINDGNYKGTYDYLKTGYYDSYLKTIFPDVFSNEKPINKRINKELVHLTSKKFLNKNTSIEFLDNLQTDSSLKYILEWADVYLFPMGIGIFSIKLNPVSNPTLNEISSFLNKVRMLSSKINIDNNITQLNKYIETQLINDVALNSGWEVLNPQLKSYIQLDIPDTNNLSEIDKLLYDIGNISPIGSASGEGLFAPSEVYFEEQIDKYRISVFKNWSALCLYDTFTRITQNFPDKFKSWEYDYFNLYIYTIYLKSFLYVINNELTDVIKIDKKTNVIRDSFIEFINDNYHHQISYKFLPDLLKDKLYISLEIQSEIEKMEIKINRINSYAQEKRSQKTNNILIILTLLSIFSVINDIISFTTKMGWDNYLSPKTISLSVFISILFVILYFVINKRK